MKRAMLLAVLLTPVILGAQIPEILPGSRVKVSVAAATFTGTLMSQSPDTLVIAESGTVHQRIPTGTILQIRVARGNSGPAGAATGFKRGALVGAISGGALLALSGGEGVVVGAAAFGAFGAVCGTVVGFLVGAEGWRRVY